MSKLGFLKQISVVAAEPPKRTGGGVRKEWNPTSGLAIRVWKNGKVFPSQELVDKFDLEYRPRIVDDSQVDPAKAPAEGEGKVRYKPQEGNGFDVADTNDFPAFNTGGTRLLIAALTKKSEGKVDLFNTVGYNEDNTPAVGVMDQGSATFGKDFLIPAIEEIYGIRFHVPGKDEVKGEDGTVIPAVAEIPGVEYVDLILLGQDGENSEAFRLPAGKPPIAFLPKKVARGEKKGETTVVRRENPEMYVLYPKKLLEDSTADPADQSDAKLSVDTEVVKAKEAEAEVV